MLCSIFISAGTVSGASVCAALYFINSTNNVVTNEQLVPFTQHTKLLITVKIVFSLRCRSDR